MMTLQQKLDFVHKQTKLALEHVQHFDAGGTALNGPTSAAIGNAVNPASNGIAGAIGNILGTNNKFQATSANIQQGTNANQLNAAYTGAQGALNQAGQQANTLNTGLNQGTNSQNTLTNELTAESQGQGAAQQAAQSALNQNTGQNIAQQAALAASTRGAGANAGLIAENAANTGANLQQTAVGQEATNQANNALAAQNQLQNLASTQVNQGTAATQLNNQTQQNEQNILQNANTAANNAAVTQQSNINTTNASVAAGNQNANQGLLGGIGQGLSAIGGFLGLADGGQVPDHLSKMAEIYHPHLSKGGAAKDFRAGGQVPGTPKVNHDDYDNDTVDAKLSPGESVIDLDTLKDKGKLGQMARFVAKEIERKKAGRKLA